MNRRSLIALSLAATLARFFPLGLSANEPDANVWRTPLVVWPVSKPLELVGAYYDPERHATRMVYRTTSGRFLSHELRGYHVPAP